MVLLWMMERLGSMDIYISFCNGKKDVGLFEKKHSVFSKLDVDYEKLFPALPDEVKTGAGRSVLLLLGCKTQVISSLCNFQKGDVSTLVSSKHSKEKLKKLLAKPKDLWIFHCCGFQVLDSYFNRWEMQEVKGSHYQYSNDKKNWKDYNPGR